MFCVMTVGIHLKFIFQHNNPILSKSRIFIQYNFCVLNNCYQLVFRYVLLFKIYAYHKINTLYRLPFCVNFLCKYRQVIVVMWSFIIVNQQNQQTVRKCQNFVEIVSFSMLYIQNIHTHAIHSLKLTQKEVFKRKHVLGN